MPFCSTNAHIDNKVIRYGLAFGMIFLLASCGNAGPEAGNGSHSNDALSVKAGDRVFAGLEDWENLYPGVVLEVEGDTYSVQFDDGDNGEVDRSQIIIDDLRAGDTLSCDWKGRGSYYSGQIRSRTGRQIEIDYDDGDLEKTNIQNCVVDAATALAKSNRSPSQGSKSQQDKPAKAVSAPLADGIYYPRKNSTTTESEKWVYAYDWERLCKKINGVTKKFHNAIKVDGLVIGTVKQEFSEMIDNGLPYTSKAYPSPSNDMGRFDEDGSSISCMVSITVSGIHRGSQKILKETLYVNEISVSGGDILAHGYGNYWHFASKSPN
jgi:hypothetical protein